MMASPCYGNGPNPQTNGCGTSCVIQRAWRYAVKGCTWWSWRSFPGFHDCDLSGGSQGWVGAGPELGWIPVPPPRSLPAPGEIPAAGCFPDGPVRVPRVRSWAKRAERFFSVAGTPQGDPPQPQPCCGAVDHTLCAWQYLLALTSVNDSAPCALLPLTYHCTGIGHSACGNNRVIHRTQQALVEASRDNFIPCCCFSNWKRLYLRGVSDPFHRLLIILYSTLVHDHPFLLVLDP